MGDLSDVVDDGRLGLRKEQVKIMKLHVEKERSREEKEVSMALASMWEVISDQCQLKLNANQESDSITGAAVSKVRGANKIRELYRSICEIPENSGGIGMERSNKLKANGNL